VVIEKYKSLVTKSESIEGLLCFLNNLISALKS